MRVAQKELRPDKIVVTRVVSQPHLAAGAGVTVAGPECKRGVVALIGLDKGNPCVYGLIIAN